MPPKKTHNLGNIRDVKSQLPPVAPSAAVECAAAEDTTPGMVDDDEGYSSCSDEFDNDPRTGFGRSFNLQQQP